MKYMLLILVLAIFFGAICISYNYGQESQEKSSATVVNTSVEDAKENTVSKLETSTTTRIKVGEGVYQMIDRGTELQYWNMSTNIQRYPSSTGNKVFYLKTLNDNAYTLDDYCKRRYLHIEDEDYYCYPYSAELYNEFIILNKDGEVLYKFKLEEGYALVAGQGGVYGAQVAIFFSEGVDGAKVDFKVFKWDDFSSLEFNGELVNYELNLETGKLTTSHYSDEENSDAVQILTPNTIY